MSGLSLRIRPDKVGSACIPFRFGPYLTVRREPVAAEGACVVGRVLSAREVYGDLELASGRPARLVPGDIVVGVLGNRAALRGFSGRTPTSLSCGDTIHLLNVGGVLGLSEGVMVGLGEPIRIEVLGTPMLEGRPAMLADFGLAPVSALPSVMPPVLVVAGTCMNAGKSTAAAAVIRHLRAKGLIVHAGKATGVAAIRDPLSFLDHGAARASSFLDCGVPSTAYRSDVPALTRTLLAALAADRPDVIVLELGDGLMGAYGVDDLIAAPDLAACFHGAMLAANDIIGGWAGANALREKGIAVRVATGPATDNLAGVHRLRAMGIPAANCFREPEDLCELATRDLMEVLAK